MLYHPNKLHQPPHIYLDETIYFVTAHISDNSLTLTEIRRKELLYLFLKLAEEYDFKVFVYSILLNHYHFMFKVSNAKHLPELFRKLHGSLSFKWNKEDNSMGRNNFQSYWDYCIRDDKDFWKHYNYIHQNPIKHGLVKNLEELQRYEFCSYNYWVKSKGMDWTNDVWENYPITEYIVQND